MTEIKLSNIVTLNRNRFLIRIKLWYYYFNILAWSLWIMFKYLLLTIHSFKSLFRTSIEKGTALLHRSKSGFEVYNYLTCKKHTPIDDIFQPCAMSGIIFMEKGDYIQMQLLDCNTLTSVKKTELYFGAILIAKVSGPWPYFILTFSWLFNLIIQLTLKMSYI